MAAGTAPAQQGALAEQKSRLEAAGPAQPPGTEHQPPAATAWALALQGYPACPPEGSQRGTSAHPKAALLAWGTGGRRVGWSAQSGRHRGGRVPPLSAVLALSLWKERAHSSQRGRERGLFLL